MASERIDIVISERGGSRVVRQMDEIAGRSTVANTAVKALQRSLLALGGIAIFRAVIGQLATFEQTLSTVRAISGATEEQFQDLRAVAQELGATTRFSATQAAEGLLFLSRAGFDTAEAIDVVDDTLRLAQAGALDLGRAADIATNVLTGFQLGTGEAGRIVDVLALAANSANTNVEQLGDAIKFVAPVAASFGVSVEEASGAIGVLSNAGLQGTLAGTGLRRVLSELEKDSPKLTKALSATGLRIEDIRPSAVGLGTALRNLRDAGLTGAQALDIFGQRGGPAALALLANVEATEELIEKLNNAAGTAERVAEIMDDNLPGALFAVRSAAEAVNLAFGEGGVTGVLEDFLRGVASALRFLARNIEILQGLLIGLAVRAIPIAVGALRILSRALLATPIGALAMFGTLVGSLVAMADQIKIASDRAATLEDVFVATFQIVGEMLEPVREALTDLATNVLQTLGFAVDGLEFNIEGLFRFLARGVDRVVRLFVVLGESISTAFDSLSDDPEIAFRQIFNTLVEIVERAITTIISLLQSFGDVFLRILSTLRNVIEQNASGIAQGLRGNVRASRLAFEAAAQAQDTLTDQLAASPALFRDAFDQNIRALDDLNFFEFLKFEVPEGEVSDLVDTISLAFQQELQARAGQPGPAEQFLDSVLERAENIARTRVAQEEIRRLTEEQGEFDFFGFLRSIGQQPGGGGQDDPIRGAIDGFKAGFEEINGIIENFSDQAQATIVNAFGAAEDALVEFVQTGEFNFSKLVDSILADLTRLLFRQALFGLVGAFGGGGGNFNLGSFLFGGGRQNGGPVTTGRSFLVGEQGPELFTPPSNGMITPNGELGGQSGPVNLTIINQTSREEILEAINSAEGENVIVNTISRKRRAVREVIQN